MTRLIPDERHVIEMNLRSSMCRALLLPVGFLALSACAESTWRVSNLVARADAVHAWLWQASRLDTSAVERQTTLDRSSERCV